MESLTAKERQTIRFINANPTELVLTRHTKVEDGAGGHTTTPVALEAQVVRVVQHRMGSTVERRSTSGEVVTPTITLVCDKWTDVERDDTFTWQGLKAEVVWVNDLGYVKHAEAVV